MTLTDKWVPIAAVLIAGFVLRTLVRTLNRPKFFPGPPRLPVIGNLFQMPKSEQWETYLKWKETYGDIIYLEVMGASLLVLNSYQRCVDLLEKRSDIYSDRPNTIVTNQMMGWEKSVVTGPYSDRWRRYRRMTAQSLKKEAVKRFHPVQEREIARFLGSLIEEPTQFMKNFRFAAARSLLMNMYGIEVKEAHDPIISVAERAMEVAVVGAQPGNFLVDLIPALRYVPDWFPGAGWKRFAALGKKLTDQMIDLPFNKTVEAMKSGVYEPSLAAINLEKHEDPEIVKWCAGTMLSAGTDTTVASIHAFILAMVLYPVVQKKAQAELDAVIGRDRLPTVEDRDDLPYINAMMREMIRWQPVSPIALPHRLIKDDVYDGHFIPAGTIVLGNTWAISRDPMVYHDPETFNPDRFLPMFDKSISHKPEDIPMDPMLYGFGYGRRVCAGMHYAEAMIFLTMTRLLATFDITTAKDGQGNDIVPKLHFNSNIVREALPFPCVIMARSEAAKGLVLANVNC
ncbi:unnamed protein product [Cyclocybe aegerita]|uniref:Cytochrome P450 n=1 Tax=Cyclocybe aegerita TaxID=1973307 RepID=A0A8S0WM47_CYCAE|nr:unnamed protein product [Cyclocybe aegerita]